MVVADKVLFTKYYKLLCFFAWKMVKDQALAEDLAQDAFVSYFQNKSRVSTDEAAIKGFLYSAVRFAVFNQNRKSHSEKNGFFWIIIFLFLHLIDKIFHLIVFLILHVIKVCKKK